MRHARPSAEPEMSSLVIDGTEFFVSHAGGGVQVTAEHPDGRQGALYANWRPDGLYVDAIEADRGAQIGTRLYELAAAEACRRGEPLVSDALRSRIAEGFWRKQARKRRAQCKSRHWGYHYAVDDVRESAPRPKKEDLWPCERWTTRPDVVCDAQRRGVPGGRPDLSGLSLSPANVALGIGAAGILLLLLSRTKLGTGFVYGGPDDPRGLSRDPNLLLPSFARQLNSLFLALRARGFDPILWEGYRTPARAASLSTTGAGIADSMHSYGAAADILSASRMWGWPEFYQALGQEAARLNLVWGGTWRRADGPHVQALSVASQDAFRALARAGGDLNSFVAQQQGVAA